MRIYVSDEVKETAAIPMPWGSLVFTFALDELWEVTLSLDTPSKEDATSPLLTSPWVKAAEDALDSGLSLTEEEINLLFSTHRMRDLPEATREVLFAVAHIPCGTFKTYSEVACEVGRPKAVRAVGQIMAHNPFPILIPCHRVLSKEMKEKLDILNPKSFEGRGFGGCEELIPVGAWLRMNDLTHAA